MEAIVLAGGFGTRLRPLVADVPKPMAPIEGRPFLERLLDYWIAQGVDRFILSLGYRAGQIVAHFGEHYRGARLAYSTEDNPLGTGGAACLAMEAVSGSEALVLNGDTFFEVDLAGLQAFHAAHSADCTLSLFRSDDSSRYLGVTLDSAARVKSFGKAACEPLLVNGGVYLFRSGALRGHPWRRGEQFSLESDLLPHALDSGWRVFGREVTARFIDIGLPEDYSRAANVLKE